MKIVLVTGGFDPLHSGHIKYFEEASKLGDQLIVGLNSDQWLVRKKGQAFLPLEERKTIVKSLKWVKGIVTFNDDDNTAINAIEKVRLNFPSNTIIFANGGDRTQDNIPEMSISDSNLQFAFGVGGNDKSNSSSWILEEWKAPKTERPWGYYRVLHDVSGTKVKELTIMPGQRLSMQRHKHRSEYWHVTEGTCDVASKLASGYILPSKTLHKNENLTISKNDWHQLTNPYDVPCRLVEIQYGVICTEDDIEREQ